MNRSEWSDEELEKLVRHYQYFSSIGKTYILQQDFLPKKTVKQIRSKARYLRKTGKWNQLHEKFGL